MSTLRINFVHAFAAAAFAHRLEYSSTERNERQRVPEVGAKLDGDAHHDQQSLQLLLVAEREGSDEGQDHRAEEEERGD